MFEVTVYKGSGREITLGNLTWPYAITLFVGLIVTVALYIVLSLAYNIGFLGLLFSIAFFVGFSAFVVRLSKRYGKGGLSKTIARYKLPERIKGGITLISRIELLESCSKPKRR